MQVIKFVNKEFKSPGIYRQLDYSKFGSPIEVEVDPKEYGQCAKGIHVIPINEDADFENVIFTETMILLEVAEEDIVYCGKNGKMRVRKATPIRQVKKSDKEWEIIRKAAYKDPIYAYCYARDVDKKPTDEARTVACKDSHYAYWYAKDIDKKPTDETRTAACKSSHYAYMYALHVDKGPTDETRIAACQDSSYAYWYAISVDKSPTDETRIAACQDSSYAYYYAKDVDKKPTDETRTAASKDPYWGKKYKLWEKEQCK
jgi:hypothetical protein